ncbi:GNAT family N-acetyltransferase [Actinosynnema sp. NPDC020468]|uniref:GNAT family N-acetyltransferase n=1 Tax=Actinosynnema sp. NPDC020468 TaxID=3154488 RepID=UPI0033F500B5
MDIRRLSPSDWAVWRDVRLTALAADPAGSPAKLAVEEQYGEAEWRRLLGPDAGVKVVAVEPGHPDPIGLVAGMPQEEHPEVLYVYSLWVKPGFRRRGVGEALMADVLAWAREHGRPLVRLRVLGENPGARRLYARLGFTGEGEVLTWRLSG